MANYDLGTARGRIDIDSGGAERSIGKVAAAQSELTKGSGRNQAALRTTGIALAGVGAAAVAGIGLAIKTAAGFEKQVSAIGAVSGASGKQLEQLRNKALQLGADTSFSAGEAAQAMEELAKAGVPVEGILNGAADATVALAAAGEVDLPQAAAIAANAMNQFNIPASKMAHIADEIAGAANASAIDVTDFGNSMAQAGATANLVGLSFDDTALAITAMGNAGIKGSDAGTSLKTFLANLIPQTKQQTGLMKELGIITEKGGNQFFDAAGHVKSMAQISDVLQTSLKGMTDEQKSATLQTLFGSDAIRAAAVVAKQGSKGFNDLAEKMGKIKAADVAKARLDNFEGSVEQLKGSLETLVIKVGTPFLGFVRTLVDGFTKVVNALSAAPEPVRNLVVAVVLATGAAIGVAGAIILIGTAIQKLKTIMTGLDIAGALTNPIVLAIVAIAAIVAGLVLLYKHSARARDIMNQIFQFFLPAIQATERFLKNFVKQFQNMIQVFKDGDDVAQGLGEVIDSMFGGTGNLIGPVRTIVTNLIALWKWVDKLVTQFGGWKKVLAIVGAAVAVLVSPLAALVLAGIAIWRNWDKVLPVLKSVAAVIVVVAQAVGRFAVAVVDQTKKAVDWLNKNVFPTFFALGELIAAVVQRIIGILVFLAPAFKAQLSTVVAVIQIGMNAIMAVIGFILRTIQTLWSEFGGNIIASIQIAWDIIKLVIQTVMGIIRGVIQVVTGIISGDWSKVWEGIQTIFGTIWEAIKGIVSLAIRIVRQIISVAINAIQAAWKIAWDTVKTVLSAAWEAIKSAVISGVNIVVTFLGTLPSKILHAIGSLISLLFNAGKDLIQGLINGYLGVWKDVLDFFGGLEDTVKGAIGNTIDWLYDIGKDIIQGLLNGIKAGIKLIGGAISGIKDGVTGGVKKIFHINSPAKVMYPSGSSITEGIGEGMLRAIPMLNHALGSIADTVAATTISAPPVAVGGGGGGDTFNFEFTFGDLTDPAVATTVRAAVTDKATLQEIIRAVHAGRKN